MASSPWEGLRHAKAEVLVVTRSRARRITARGRPFARMVFEVVQAGVLARVLAQEPTDPALRSRRGSWCGSEAGDGGVLACEPRQNSRPSLAPRGRSHPLRGSHPERPA